MNITTDVDADVRVKAKALYDDTQLLWQIQREWNKSKREPVEMTVEQALAGLNMISQRHPLTVLASRAVHLIGVIITRQDDSLTEQEIAMDTYAVEEEDSSHQKDHQGTLAN